MNLAKVLSGRMEKYTSKAAIIFEDQNYTYAELNASVKKYAAFLKHLGVKKGDRLALQLPKCMDFIFLHLANLSLGGITLPLNTAYTPEEVKYFLADSGSSIFFTDTSKYEKVRDVVEKLQGVRVILIDDESFKAEIDKAAELVSNDNFPDYPTVADDVAMICYTSGTTGKPKGAMITHRNLVSNTLALQDIWQWTADDILMHVLPLFHVHGLCVALHGGLNSGSTIIMHEKFEPKKCWRTIEKEKCTMFMAVPTIYFRLVNEWSAIKPDLGSMRVFISGSAPLTESLFLQFEATTGYRILERYGMTEAQMITSNPYDSTRRIPRSVGYPLPGVNVRIISESGQDVQPGEIGELWVKGDNIFKSYWQMPEASRDTFVDGWFKTGDLAYQDAADQLRLYLAGRAKELIISGGYNVYPKEVEYVLDQHEAVRESAVIGLPDEDFGERIAAVVVLKAEQKSFSDIKALVAYCKERLAGYKCPKDIFFIDELPRNTMGKVQKNVLKERYQKKD